MRGGLSNWRFRSSWKCPTTPTRASDKPSTRRSNGSALVGGRSYVGVALALALSAAPQIAGAGPCPRGTLTGQVTFVRDGDTIEVRGLPIRLNGLAAPEWDEPGGGAAMDAMIDLVAGRTLRCELNGERTHDRCVGVCYLEGVDISAEMVRWGGRSGSPALQWRYQQAEAQASAGGATIARAYRLPGYCRER
jgi:micrococcal nuclease